MCFHFSPSAEQTSSYNAWTQNNTAQRVFFPPTRPVSWRVVEEAEAEHQEDDGSPGDFAQQLQAADSSPLHGSESQHHGSPDDEDKPVKKEERDFIKSLQCVQNMNIFKSD